ncbi:GNAT family N-acetyltransferase [Tellurirhabdus bombi]|uniref:GNAT family N-acetyltransferase n=1 Tax=Tellurirhabdus bombi TaxID=2907205 RepID=UPI001F1BF305|nr:GNAT family N-acetyltransferase [Tellurirhabdus bombi]
MRPDRKRELWKAFAKYHYLSDSFNVAAQVFVVTVNGQLAGFTAVLNFPHAIVKNALRIHRTVVLPAFQGIGLGITLRNMIAARVTSQGKQLLTTTTHPALIRQMHNDPRWVCTFKGRHSKPGKKSKLQVSSCNRLTTSWKYVPPK